MSNSCGYSEVNSDFNQSHIFVQGYVYSASQNTCWIKWGCSERKYEEGIKYAAHPPKNKPWIANLQYGARIIDTKFRRSLVNSCNKEKAAEIEAVLINPVGGVPSGFTKPFAGAMGSSTSFGLSQVTKSFEKNNLILTKDVIVAGKTIQKVFFLLNVYFGCFHISLR